jgi:hypothetical protein
MVEGLTVVVGKGSEMAENISVILSFAFMTIEFDDKHSLKVSDVSADFYSFYSFFSSFPASNFSLNGR